MPSQTPVETVSALESGCEKAIQSATYRDWAQRANQVVDFKNAASFEARLRQERGRGREATSGSSRSRG